MSFGEEVMNKTNLYLKMGKKGMRQKIGDFYHL